MGDYQLQRNLDPRIDAFYPIKRNEEGFESVIYLSYKPILMTSARDFLYYKKTKKLNSNVNINNIIRYGVMLVNRFQTIINLKKK